MLWYWLASCLSGMVEWGWCGVTTVTTITVRTQLCGKQCCVGDGPQPGCDAQRQFLLQLVDAVDGRYHLVQHPAGKFGENGQYSGAGCTPSLDKTVGITR